MKKLLYFFLAYILVWACIPIEDKIKPTIEPFRVEKEYHLLDSLIVPLTFRDNEKLDSFTWAIRDLSGSLTNRWGAVSSGKKIRGGRLRRERFAMQIPATAEQNTYSLTINVYDGGKNITTSTDTFRILGDNEKPTIDFQVTNPYSIDKATGLPLFCRLDVIRLKGKITDNVGLQDITAEIRGKVRSPKVLQFTTAYDFSEELFRNDIRLPTDIEDNTTLQLSISVTDLAGNINQKSFTFFVNCDDKPPIIQIDSTRPSINAESEAGVIEGTEFRILQGKISDNRHLKDFSITFNPLNALKRDTIFSRRAIKTGGPLELKSLLTNTVFKLPTTSKAGDVYEVLLNLSDTSGNSAPVRRILLNVLKDELPSIFVTNTYLDNQEFVVLSGNNPIKAGQTLKIEGKIEEDNKLDYIRINWGQRGQLQEQVRLNAAQLITLPFDFSDPQSKKTFKVPETAASGAIYELEIRVKDSKNDEVVRKYVFVIQ
jgi:hypothetical protein